MGQTIELIAADGHRLEAYQAMPAGVPRGAVLVVQEIFGANDHIRKVADGFAAGGYVAIALALFDRIRPGIEIGYSMAEIQEGFGYKTASKTGTALRDIEAAVKAVATAGKVGVVEYCWGGFLAWMAAARVSGRSAAAPYYYGGRTGCHRRTTGVSRNAAFWREGQLYPDGRGAKLKAAHPQKFVHVYDADRGFNCDQRGSWHQPSAILARERTLEFFRKHLG